MALRISINRIRILVELIVVILGVAVVFSPFGEPTRRHLIAMVSKLQDTNDCDSVWRRYAIYLGDKRAYASTSTRLLGFDRAGGLLLTADASQYLHARFRIESFRVRITDGGRKYEIATDTVQSAHNHHDVCALVAGYDAEKIIVQTTPQLGIWSSEDNFCSPINKATIYRTTRTDRPVQRFLERSKNNGIDWERLDVRVYGRKPFQTIIRYFHPTDAQIFFVECRLESLMQNKPEKYFLMTQDEGNHFTVLGESDQYSFLEISRSDPKLWYRIAENRLVLRSENAAQGPWIRIHEIGLANQIAVHTSGTPLFLASSFNGLMRSGDAGRSWSVVYLGTPPSNRIQGIAFDPHYSDVLYVASQGGFYLSSDTGETWTKVDLEEKIGRNSFRRLRIVDQ